MKCKRMGCFGKLFFATLLDLAFWTVVPWVSKSFDAPAHFACFDWIQPLPKIKIWHIWNSYHVVWQVMSLYVLLSYEYDCTAVRLRPCHLKFPCSEQVWNIFNDLFSLNVMYIKPKPFVPQQFKGLFLILQLAIIVHQDFFEVENKDT